MFLLFTLNRHMFAGVLFIFINVRNNQLLLQIKQIDYHQICPFSMTRVARHEICKNTGFHWPVLSRIRTEATILSIYGRIRVSENPYSRIFMQCRITNKTTIAKQSAQYFPETSKKAIIWHKISQTGTGIKLSFTL